MEASFAKKCKIFKKYSPEKWFKGLSPSVIGDCRSHKYLSRQKRWPWIGIITWERSKRGPSFILGCMWRIKWNLCRWSLLDIKYKRERCPHAYKKLASHILMFNTLGNFYPKGRLPSKVVHTVCGPFQYIHHHGKNDFLWAVTLQKIWKIHFECI